MARDRKAEPSLSSSRAGMTLARAERLAAKTGTRSRNASSVYALLGLAAVVGMAGYGVLVGTGTDAAVTAAESADQAVATLAVSAPAPTPAVAPPPAPAPALLVAAEVEAAPTTPVATTEGTPAETCIDAIEGQLLALRSQATNGEPWMAQQSGLTQLVQMTLDCEGAGFRVAGSLELVGSGLADLKVHWDREGKVLDLAMIDRSAGQPAVTPAASDGSAIEFVIR